MKHAQHLDFRHTRLGRMRTRRLACRSSSTIRAASAPTPSPDRAASRIANTLLERTRPRTETTFGPASVSKLQCAGIVPWTMQGRAASASTEVMRASLATALGAAHSTRSTTASLRATTNGLSGG